MENNKYLLPLALVVAGAMIAGAIYMGGKVPSTSNQPATTRETQEVEIPLPNQEDRIIGSLDAEIVIVEYSDTECPWCKVFHNTMLQIVDEYDGQVAWIYRHMPFHDKSLKESQAAECAYEIGGNSSFWKYVNQIFEVTPSNDGLDLEQLPVIANEIGLNTSSFNECLSSERHLEDITNNLQLARPGEIEGTPYSIIIHRDGKRDFINGAQPLNTVKAKIDALIQN